MMELNPFFDFERSQRKTYVQLFNDPFCELFDGKDQFFDQELGLYLIGEGHSILYSGFSGNSPLSKILGRQNLGRKVEFQIFADQTCLDFPYLKNYNGVLKQNNLLELEKNFFHSILAKIGFNYFHSSSALNKLDSETSLALQLDENRRKTGEYILKNYEKKENNPPQLQQVLESYLNQEPTELAEIIPLVKHI